MRVPAQLASDGRSLDALKTGAAKDPKGAVRQAATQFEALFMQMVLKSMRDSVPKSGMLEGAGTDVYQGMLDTQFAQSMSGRAGGLSDMIARQLMRGMKADGPVGDAADAGIAPGASGVPPRAMPRVSADGLARALLARDASGTSDGARADDDEPSMLSAGMQVAAAAAAAARARYEAAQATRRAAVDGMPIVDPGGNAAMAGAAARGGAQGAFVERMWGAAAAAQSETGVPAGFIVGQAALESGWGRQEIRHADGRSAHNLFGIKAGAGWRGATVEATTTEWVDGQPRKSVERFRAYGSYQEAFSDWARLMSSNPRYSGVLAAGGSVESFARNLQKAGYATDPDYASKLTRTITQALQLRRTTT